MIGGAELKDSSPIRGYPDLNTLSEKQENTRIKIYSTIMNNQDLYILIKKILGIFLYSELF